MYINRKKQLTDNDKYAVTETIETAVLLWLEVVVVRGGVGVGGGGWVGVCVWVGVCMCVCGWHMKNSNSSKRMLQNMIRIFVKERPEDKTWTIPSLKTVGAYSQLLFHLEQTVKKRVGRL